MAYADTDVYWCSCSHGFWTSRCSAAVRILLWLCPVLSLTSLFMSPMLDTLKLCIGKDVVRYWSSQYQRQHQRCSGCNFKSFRLFCKERQWANQKCQNRIRLTSAPVCLPHWAPLVPGASFVSFFSVALSAEKQKRTQMIKNKVLSLVYYCKFIIYYQQPMD